MTLLGCRADSEILLVSSYRDYRAFENNEDLALIKMAIEENIENSVSFRTIIGEKNCSLTETILKSMTLNPELVFIISDGLDNSYETVIADYPKVHFVVLDGNENEMTNYSSLSYDIETASYLAAYTLSIDAYPRDFFFINPFNSKMNQKMVLSFLKGLGDLGEYYFNTRKTRLHQRFGYADFKEAYPDSDSINNTVERMIKDYILDVPQGKEIFLLNPNPIYDFLIQRIMMDHNPLARLVNTGQDNMITTFHDRFSATFVKDYHNVVYQILEDYGHNTLRPSYFMAYDDGITFKYNPRYFIEMNRPEKHQEFYLDVLNNIKNGTLNPRVDLKMFDDLENYATSLFSIDTYYYFEDLA
jgi:hypothetical protein